MSPRRTSAMTASWWARWRSGYGVAPTSGPCALRRAATKVARAWRAIPVTDTRDHAVAVPARRTLAVRRGEWTHTVHLNNLSTHLVADWLRERRHRPGATNPHPLCSSPPTPTGIRHLHSSAIALCEPPSTSSGCCRASFGPTMSTLKRGVGRHPPGERSRAATARSTAGDTSATYLLCHPPCWATEFFREADEASLRGHAGARRAPGGGCPIRCGSQRRGSVGRCRARG
ncbi:hypothetical protein GA0115254_115554 [Streptomyces sp. Ncost-T10-10d]|nr:hypothetical protein GA0115254_115554 [Streptomyces sp. Ncost-T10-10d]